MIAAKRAPGVAWVRALAALCMVVVSCHRPNSEPPRDRPLVDLMGKGQVDGLAETRHISFGDGDRSHLLEGWSGDEHDHTFDLPFVWATALEASISFQILQVEDLQFLVKVRAFPSEAPQVITVLVNGSEVSRFTAAPAFLEYRFVVRADGLRRGENRLTFRHSVLTRHSDDLEPRQFAAAYNSILIGPQCLPLRAWGLALEPRVHHRKASRSQPAVLVVTGPALVHRRLLVPAEGVLRYRLSLASGEKKVVVSTLRIRDGESTREMAESRISGSPFGNSWLDVEVDLSPWSGRTVDLELEVCPLPCRSSVATVVVERAGIFAARARTG
jgi:hypothetical protein